MNNSKPHFIPAGSIKGTRTALRAAAFSRTDLLMTAGAAAGLACLVAGAAAQSRTRSLPAVCANNLRTLGQSFGLFEADNAGSDPWRAPAYNNAGLKQNAWYHFALLSNYVSSPQIFACPADTVRPARDFSSSTDGGFLQLSHLNNSISYMVGLDSSVFKPNSVLAADRNLRCPGGPSPCSSGVNPALTIATGRGVVTGWNAGLHGPSGNLLLRDGRVEETSNESVNRRFNGEDDNASTHFLSPRN